MVVHVSGIRRKATVGVSRYPMNMFSSVHFSDDTVTFSEDQSFQVRPIFHRIPNCSLSAKSCTHDHGKSDTLTTMEAVLHALRPMTRVDVRTATACPWYTMEFSQLTAWTKNRSLLVESCVKAFPRRPTNSGSNLSRAAHLKSGVTWSHQCVTSH